MNKISKIFSKKSALIAGIILFALTIPFFAQAGLADWIVNKAFRFVAKLILSLVGFLAQLATSFFGAMLKIGFDRNSQGVAQIGWEQSRNFANLLFILFMVVVAFATILRLERYGAKQLLPKIIIIALLINFSFVICAVIIDFSNLTANIFINNANNESGPKGVGAQLVENMKLATTLTPSLCADYDLRQSECDELLGDDAAKCKAELEKKKTDCEEAQKIAQQSTSKGDELVNLVMTTIIGAIVLLIATFVLFAAGILLLIRVIAIWFLVILSPIVFILYIMPGLRPYYERWWKSFINWCIFAPIFAFFMWIALKASKSISLLRMTRMQAAIQAGDPSQITGFFADGSAILNYFLVIGLLIGGMIAAKQLGIYGASTALAIGKKWGKGATDWTKRKVTGGTKEAGAIAGGLALQQVARGISKIPLLKKTKMAQRMEARGIGAWQKTLSTKEMQDYLRLTGLMSTDQKAKELKSITTPSSKKTALAKQMQESGELYKIKDEKAVKSAENMLRAYGFKKAADDIKEHRPGTEEDKAEREKTIDNAEIKGVHKEWQQPVFDDVRGKEVVDYMIQKDRPLEKVVDILEQMRKDTRESAMRANKDNFTNFDDIADEKRRQTYALVTNDWRTAFTDASGFRDDKLEEFIRSTSTTNIKGVNSDTARLISGHIDVSIASEAGSGWSKEIKQIMAPEIENKVRAMITGPAKEKAEKDLRKLKNTTAWAPYFT